MNLNNWELFIYSVGISFLTLSCVTPRVNNINLLDYTYQGYADDPNDPYDSIIKLTSDGNFFCTGFVIDDHYAVTAAHCVDEGSLLFQAPKLSKKNIDILSKTGFHTGVVAKAAAMNNRQDYAVIRGDFSLFRKVKIDTTTAPVLYSKDKIYRACGFPSGQPELVCVDLKPDGNEYFHIMGIGDGLYPGMSGGPVYDLRTNTVVGVNSYVGKKYVAFGPLIGMLAHFGL